MVWKLIRRPLSLKKFEAIIVVRRLEGLSLAQTEGDKAMVCKIKWKGQKGALRSLRRHGKRNLTKEVGVSECGFSGYKEGVFSPWEFSISSGIGFGLVKGAESGMGSLESFSAGEASGQILAGDSGLQRGKTKPFAFRKNKFSFVKSKPLNNLTSSWPLLIFTACVL
jgi:hypothetical protein